MFSVCGIAGLWALQISSARNELHAYRKQTEADEEQHRELALSSSSAPTSSAKPRAPNLSQTIRDGAIVCFRDKRGQTAVVQPFGTGRSQWQLAVTCASGGCCFLSQGEASLQYVAADAAFLVCHVDGNKFAFRSLGAEGRYLSATRDLNEAPVIEHQKVTQAAQWKVTNSGIVSAQFGHKRLGYTAHELKAVPVEAIAVMERLYDAQLQSHRDQASQAEVVLQSTNQQLQGVTAELVEAHQQHADTVDDLTCRWRKAEHHIQKLQQAAAVRDEGILQLEGYLQQLKDQHEKHEQELLSAYDKVAQLQQQLEDLDEESQQQQTALQDALASAAAAHEAYVAKLQRQHSNQIEQLTARHKADTKQWAELRAKLEINLHHKDKEVDELSGKAHRLDAALREVQRLMWGSSRRQRVDRASLEAVSIHQLQHAVAQFAAAGEEHVAAVPSSMRESQAIQDLLSSQPYSDGSSAGDFNHEQHHHHLHQQGLDSNDTSDNCCVEDLGWTADQSPRKGKLLQGDPTLATGRGRELSPAAAHLHDSPLMKLAATSSSSSASQMHRGSSSSSSPGRGMQQGVARVHTAGVNRNRVMHSAALPSSEGSGWAAPAARKIGEDARTSSWPASGSPGRLAPYQPCSTAVVRRTSGQQQCGAAAAVEGELSAHWGTDVAVSGSSRQAGSFTSSDHAHRYSCSELSEADSSSQTAADDEYQLGVEDLEAIHSVGQSMEEEQGLRRLLTISSNGSNGTKQPSEVAAPKAGQQEQQQPEAGGSGGFSMCVGKQQQLGLLRSSGGVYGRSSLTPVREEQPEKHYP